MKKNNIKNFFLYFFISLGIANISYLCIQPQIFNMDNIKNNKLNYLYLNIYFIFLIFIFLKFLFYLIKGLMQKKSDVILYLKNTLKYFAPLLIFALLIWPGHWVWDEFFLIDCVKEYNVSIWQSYITDVFYSVSMFIFPSPIAILLIQIIFISFVMGFILTKLEKILNNKFFETIFYLLFFSPMIIINNLYPLRITMFTYLLILFFSFLIFDKIENNEFTIDKFIIYMIINFFLITWRSEGILFVIFTPILIYLTYGMKKNKSIEILKKSILAMLILILANFVYNKSLSILENWIDEEKSKYSLTIYINPLSEMLNDNLSGNNLDKNLEAINKVLDIEILKNNPSFLEIPAFWGENKEKLIKKNYDKNLLSFKKAYISLILHNPLPFLSARFKTFLSTNSVYKGYTGATFGHLIDYKINENYGDATTVNNFMNNYYLTKPINYDLKAKIEQKMIGQDKFYMNHSLVAKIFWNVIPIVAIVFILFFISTFRKDVYYLTIFTIILLNFLVVFLTAPGSYFMYYVPTYLSGGLVSFIYILCNKKDVKKLYKKGGNLDEKK